MSIPLPSSSRRTPGLIDQQTSRDLYVKYSIPLTAGVLSAVASNIIDIGITPVQAAVVVGLSSYIVQRYDDEIYNKLGVSDVFPVILTDGVITSTLALGLLAVLNWYNGQQLLDRENLVISLSMLTVTAAVATAVNSVVKMY